MEKKNNWKWETLKKEVGSYFLLIDIASIFYTHEKSDRYILSWQQVGVLSGFIDPC